ncbi:MAG: sugar ABC transporter ATP-binding protein [Xanthobacteraceae bacterium]|nr:MAG: sugar ABC transporter ATP-binding protein [Xanthobacteraceae bacterium]
MSEGRANSTILSARRISKQFHATVALDDVDIEIARGSIHTLVGENGAGKSTLIKILSGVCQPDSGDVLFDGQRVVLASPVDARAHGIAVIPQELRVVPTLTVAENITLGNWPVRREFGILPRLDHRRIRQHAEGILERLNTNFDLDARIDTLAFAERQMVVIARALLHSARVLILDEPTASLKAREVEQLFDVIGKLKEAGVAIVYVSHRLDEIVRLSDQCSVFRDGRIVADCLRGEIEREQLVRLMTGRDLDELHHKHDSKIGAPILEADYAHGAETDDRFVVHRGEIVGLTGLLGNGSTHFLRSLFGAAEPSRRIAVSGVERELNGPTDAIDAGIGFVPGERALGLVMALSVRDNILLPSLDRSGGRWKLDGAAMDRIAMDMIDLLDIRPRDPRRLVRELSGGNQQKVIFARWLVAKAGVLLLDEPTNGIDVAAKARIHRLMREFVNDGGGVVLASSEAIEALSMSDNLLVLRQGKVIQKLSRDADIYSEKTLHQALGA